MKTRLTIGRSIRGAVLLSALAAPAATIGRADPNDDEVCTAQKYDRLRSESEIAATIAACSRLLQLPSTPAPQRARALYFRALNHFLDGVNQALARMQPVAGDSPAVERSLEDLGECIAVDAHRSSLPLGLRATIYTVIGRYDEALEDLDQAIRIEKTSSLFVQRALLWERRDRFSEALADLDAAVSLDAGNQNAWINRAKLWTRYGDLERAAADYDRAEAVGGLQSWDALSGRAKLSLRLGEPVRAYSDLNKAASAAPLPNLAAQLHVRAGNVARDYLKQPDKTETSYQRALEALPNHADAYIQRGIYHERANRSSQALNDFTKAIEATRNNPLEKAVHDYARYRLEVLRSRLSQKAGDAARVPNINVLSRAASQAPRDRTRRVALVIGNATYAHVAPLPNADRDAETVAEALSEAGFSKVTVATNVDKQQFEAMLQQFSTEAAAADWAMIYYAGHGIEVGSQNILVPIDASLDNMRDSGAHAVTLSQIVRAVGSAKKLRLVALDACRDNPFVQEAHRVAGRSRTASPGVAPGAAGQGAMIGGGFARFASPEPNSVVLFSTQPGQVALDGDELNSPFTRAFVKNMPVPGLELQNFFERVRDDVANVTERRQRPAINGRLRQDEKFSFFPM